MVGAAEPQLRVLLWQVLGMLALCVPIGAETASPRRIVGGSLRETANLTSPLSEAPFDANGTVLVVMTVSFQKLSAIDVVSETFFTDYYLCVSHFAPSCRRVGRAASCCVAAALRPP